MQIELYFPEILSIHLTLSFKFTTSKCMGCRWYAKSFLVMTGALAKLNRKVQQKFN